MGICDDVVYKVEQGQHQDDGEKEHGQQGNEHGQGEAYQREELPQEQKGHHEHGKQAPNRKPRRELKGVQTLKSMMKPVREVRITARVDISWGARV